MDRPMEDPGALMDDPGCMMDRPMKEPGALIDDPGCMMDPWRNQEIQGD